MKICSNSPQFFATPSPLLLTVSLTVKVLRQMVASAGKYSRVGDAFHYQWADRRYPIHLVTKFRNVFSNHIEVAFYVAEIIHMAKLQQAFPGTSAGTAKLQLFHNLEMTKVRI
jgi:hypothetical protein